MTTFAGRWLTTFGLMDLTQDADRVHGFYLSQGSSCPIEGTVAGNRFSFTYHEAAEQGKGWFELGRYGAFQGEYQPEGAERSFEWSGHRLWDGVWDTSFGRMRLVQEADRVYGFYESGEHSRVDGHLDGDRFTFRYQEPKAAGEGWFELSADAQGFAGSWRADHMPIASTWTGKRIKPTPGLTWLVAIEAHWQRSLSEREYSYGRMLHEVFARLSDVVVRQRFFNDEASLEHWCREVMYFAEPAIVLIASHGCPEGVTVHGQTINTKLVVDSLREASNIKLLHFSSCLVMKEEMDGDFARRIQKQTPFPISGYTTSVDWGGSAIIEFNYLDMMLAKGMSAEQAAALLPKLVAYAGDTPPDGSPYAAAGFRFFRANTEVPDTPRPTPVYV
jgi:hypothetical protein